MTDYTMRLWLDDFFANMGRIPLMARHSPFVTTLSTRDSGGYYSRRTYRKPTLRAKAKAARKAQRRARAITRRTSR